jgi:GTP-binding protein
MCDEGQRVVLAAGGIGGHGNTYYKSSTNQTPRKAGQGTNGVELPLQLELKLIADVGIIGFPNAGKSTLLSRLSAAKPKIASYPFTTLSPQLGVIENPDRSIVVADIPGLIEGAAEGVGLGHQFLRHVERCAFLIHLLDAAEAELEELLHRIHVLNNELERFSPVLAKRDQLLVLNKCDMRIDHEALAESLGKELGHTVIPISGISGQGLRELENALLLRLSSSNA